MVIVNWFKKKPTEVVNLDVCVGDMICDLEEFKEHYGPPKKYKGVATLHLISKSEPIVIETGIFEDYFMGDGGEEPRVGGMAAGMASKTIRDKVFPKEYWYEVVHGERHTTIYPSSRVAMLEYKVIEVE